MSRRPEPLSLSLFVQGLFLSGNSPSTIDTKQYVLYKYIDCEIYKWVYPITFSKRKVGDSSLLDTKEIKHIDQIVYPKVNFDGRLIKSISVLLEEKWMLCINCDVSLFNRMQELRSALLQIANQPESLFANDWQKKLHVSIHSYLQNHNLSFDHLSQSNKKTLAKHLFDLGAFHEKNAADYVAKVLGLGRATVFKYLKEWRNQ